MQDCHLQLAMLHIRLRRRGRLLERAVQQHYLSKLPSCPEAVHHSSITDETAMRDGTWRG